MVLTPSYMSTVTTRTLCSHICQHGYPDWYRIARALVKTRTGPDRTRRYFIFFGCTFNLVSGHQCICTCIVLHPLYNSTIEKGVLNMIEQNDCQEDGSQKQSYSSGDFQQQRTSAYINCNVLLVNCEQDWKASGHCSISVVSQPRAES